jgi:hypothetical protein
MTDLSTTTINLAALESTDTALLLELLNKPVRIDFSDESESATVFGTLAALTFIEGRPVLNFNGLSDGIPINPEDTAILSYLVEAN